MGRNKKVIAEYIRNQLQEDVASDQLSFKEYIDPFTGQQVKEGKQKTPLGAAGESVAVGKLFDEPIGSAGLMP